MVRYHVALTVLALCLVAAIAMLPRLPAWAGGMTDDQRCSKGLTLAADVRDQMARMTKGQPVAPELRRDLRTSIAAQVDDDDARFVFTALVDCLESDRAMGNRATAAIALAPQLKVALDRAEIDAESSARVNAAYGQIAPLYSENAFVAARAAQRAFVAELAAAAIVRNGAASVPPGVAASNQREWLAAVNFSEMCHATIGADAQLDGSELCREQTRRIAGARSPCLLLTKAVMLTSAACATDTAADSIPDEPGVTSRSML